MLENSLTLFFNSVLNVTESYTCSETSATCSQSHCTCQKLFPHNKNTPCQTQKTSGFLSHMHICMHARIHTHTHNFIHCQSNISVKTVSAITTSTLHIGNHKFLGLCRVKCRPKLTHKNFTSSTGYHSHPVCPVPYLHRVPDTSVVMLTPHKSPIQPCEFIADTVFGCWASRTVCVQC